MGVWSASGRLGNTLLCASGGRNLTRAHFSSALLRCRRLSYPPTPSLPHMQRSALGCGPLILLLGAQACVGWAGGAARPSRIAPTPRWCPPVRLRMGRRLYPTSVGGWQRARAIAPARCGLRTVAPPPPMPRGRACTARIAPTCAVLPPSVREVGRSPYFCNGF